MKVPVRQLIGHLKMTNDIRYESSDDFQVSTTKVPNAVAHNAKKGPGIDAIQLLSYYASSYTLGYIISACGEVFKQGIRIGGS